MDNKERAKKDLDKLEACITKFKELGFSEKYPKLFEYSQNYFKDAEHYYKKGDYFTSFGCANYAYGILEGIFLKEKGKPFHEF